MLLFAVAHFKIGQALLATGSGRKFQPPITQRLTISRKLVHNHIILWSRIQTRFTLYLKHVLS